MIVDYLADNIKYFLRYFYFLKITHWFPEKQWTKQGKNKKIREKTDYSPLLIFLNFLLVVYALTNKYCNIYIICYCLLLYFYSIELNKSLLFLLRTLYNFVINIPPLVLISFTGSSISNEISTIYIFLTNFNL